MNEFRAKDDCFCEQVSAMFGATSVSKEAT
jgi:hypothetical protein